MTEQEKAEDYLHKIGIDAEEPIYFDEVHYQTPLWKLLNEYHQHRMMSSALVSAVGKGIVHRMDDESTLTIHWSDLTDDEGEAVIKATDKNKHSKRYERKNIRYRQ
jgi:hypothetical protein